MEQALKGSPYEAEYLRTAPNPENWSKQLAKVRAFKGQVQDWPADEIRKIKAPALVIAGDADIIQPEHTVALYRLLGASQLAILPGTMHTLLTQQTDLLMAMIPRFPESTDEAP